MDWEKMLEQCAIDNGFKLAKQYSEPEAAHFVGKSLSWMKRHRRARHFRYTPMGEDGVAYTGFQIASLILKGTEQLDDGEE